MPGECPAPKVSARASVDREEPPSRPVAKSAKSEATPKTVSGMPGELPRKDTRKGDRHKPGYQAKKQKIYRERKKTKSPA